MLSLVLGVVSFVRPSKLCVRVWAAVAALETVFVAVLMLAGKSIVDGLGLVSGSFLVRNFGLGYWISFIVTFVALILVAALDEAATIDGATRWPSAFTG